MNPLQFPQEPKGAEFVLQADDRRNSYFVGIIAGPTASGKSDLAIEIAQKHDLAIISGDSMQVYKGMEIGTGAVTREEMRGVAHGLIGEIDPTEHYQASSFIESAREVAERFYKEKGKRSLIAGGTGMWIQSLREGLFDGPGKSEELRANLRHRIEKEGLGEIWKELQEVDPEITKQISENDPVRIMRALEVFELTGKPLSEWYREDQVRRNQLKNLLPLAVITWPRKQLYQRINQRVIRMIEAGWLEEAKYLYSLNLPDYSPAKKALGYRHLFRVLEEEITLEDAVEIIQKETRHFAKRQLTWFKKQREVVWIEPPEVSKVEKALGLA